MTLPISPRRSLLGRTRSLEVAGLVVATVLAAAFLIWGAHMGRAGEPAVATLWPDRAGSLVIWRGDGVLSARLTDAAGAATVSSLGAGSGAQLVVGGARPVVLLTGPGGGHRLVRYLPTTNTWTTVAASLEPTDLTTAVLDRELAFLPVDAGSRAAIVAVALDGRTVARFPLPVLEPDPSALMALPGSGVGARKTSRGHVDALLLAGGDVLAITSTKAAAAVTDLKTKRSVSLGGYTHIAAATVGGDGILYVLAGPADPAFTLRFLRVDPHSMRVLSAWDTGVGAIEEPGSALPTRFGAVFYLPGVPDSLDAYSGTNIWLVDGSGARQNSAVSSNVGVRMGPGRDDSVLSMAGRRAMSFRGSTPTTVR